MMHLLNDIIIWRPFLVIKAICRTSFVVPRPLFKAQNAKVSQPSSQKHIRLIEGSRLSIKKSKINAVRGEGAGRFTVDRLGWEK
jgi:hypothetical protein